MSEEDINDLEKTRKDLGYENFYQMSDESTLSSKDTYCTSLGDELVSLLPNPSKRITKKTINDVHDFLQVSGAPQMIASGGLSLSVRKDTFSSPNARIVTNGFNATVRKPCPVFNQDRHAELSAFDAFVKNELVPYLKSCPLGEATLHSFLPEGFLSFIENTKIRFVVLDNMKAFVADTGLDMNLL